MEVDIGRALEHYFDKQERYSKECYGIKPTVSYTDELNKKLLVSSPDEDGEVSWQALRQDKLLDWDALEKEFGFEISLELKQYYSSFYFLALNGKLGRNYLYFYPLDGGHPIEGIVRQQYADAKHLFPESRRFLIGNAVIDDDDNYFIFFDNDSEQLFCYDPETQKSLFLSGSLSKTIDEMEARC